MAYKLFEASAPGSLMLMGEHAVLQDKFALVAAVAQRMKVSLQQRSDRKIYLHSTAFPTYQTSIDNFTIEKPYQFVLAVLDAHREHLSSGYDIHIKAEFSHTMGLGSSAAVTVATLGCLRKALDLSVDLPTMLQQARAVIRKVQGRGSGADVAASIYGGVVLYQQQQLVLQVLSDFPALTAVYSGYKMLTAEVIAQVLANNSAEKLAIIYEKIDRCVQETVVSWHKKDWSAVGKLMQVHFQLQQELGVSDATLDEIVSVLEQQENCFGAKISGSGLGDCVIALGEIKDKLFPNVSLLKTEQFAVHIAEKGLIL